MLSVSDLTDDQAEWWRRRRKDEVDWFTEHVGLDLELRAEGALAIDPDETLSDVPFPGTGSTRHAALLVLERLVGLVRDDALAAEGAERVWRPVPDGGWDAAVAEVVAEHGHGFRRAYADTALLADDVADC